PADGVSLRPHLCPLDRDPDRVPAFSHHGLPHLSRDRVGDLLVGALPDRHHLGGGLALHHRLLHRHLDRVRYAPRLHALHRAADGVHGGLVARLLPGTADRVADRLHDGLLYRAADRIADVFVAHLADGVTDVISARLHHGLPDGPADRISPRLEVRLAHGTA